MSSTFSIRSLGSAYVQGVSAIFTRKSNGVNRMKALSDIETANAALKVVVAVISAIGKSTLSGLANLLQGGIEVMEAGVFFGGAKYLIGLCNKTSFTHRPFKKFGIGSLTATDACGLVAFAGAIGALNLGKIAANIGSLSVYTQSLPFLPMATVLSGVATAGFAFLLIDKCKHNYFASSSKNVKGPEHETSRNMKIVYYGIGVIGSGLACLGLANASPTLITAGAVLSVANNLLRVGRGMYSEINAANLK